MLGKLKAMAGDGALQKFIETYAPTIKEELTTLLAKASPETVSQDESFTQTVTQPLKISLAAAAGGVTGLIPGFDNKFDFTMLHLRNELMSTENDQVSLVEGFDQKLPDVLKSGFQQAKDVA